MAGTNPIPLEGRLDCWSGDFDFPELLLTICESTRTGRLELRSDEAEKKIYLKEGRIVFAASSSPDDRLGVYLMRRNEIPLAALRKLSPQVRPGVRLGTLLVQNGLLTPDGLVRAVLGQVREIILSVFRWTQASYRFLEEAPSKEETITLRIPTARLIVDGIHGIESWRRISQGLGSLDVCFVAVSGIEGNLRSADLDTASLEILAMLSHPRTVEAICASTDVADIDVCRRLWAFRILGWIETATADAAARASEDDASDAEMDSDLEGLGLILGDERDKS